MKDLFYEEFLPNFGKDSTKRVPEIKLLSQELKMQYVLITRAKQRVIFFENDKTIRKVLIDLWTNEKVNVIVVKPFDEDLKQILTVKSSPEEWCQRGHELSKL